MKKTKILSTASLLAGTFICANLAGYGNSAYAASSSGKSYSQTLADFERELEVRRARARRAAKRSEIQERRTDSDFVPASADAPRGGVPAKATKAAAWSFSLGVEGFYALATEDLFKFSDSGDYDDEEDYDDEVDGVEVPKIDLYGVNFRFTTRKNSSVFGGGVNVVPEFYGIFGLGYGNDKLTESYAEEDWGENYEDKYSVLAGQLALGANLRWIVNEHFSVFGGVRAGMSYISAKVESSAAFWDVGDNGEIDEGFEKYDKTEDGFGFLGGAGIGCDIAFNEHHALTLGADYLVSTAKAEFKDWGIKTKTQQYCVFSVGYKYTF